MKLNVVGSSSKGNGYILETEEEALIIECGCKFLDVKKALKFNVSKIVGCIVTHSHGDHAKYIGQYENCGFPVVRSWEEKTGVIKRFGGFSVVLFELIHNVPCCGFLISHKEIGRLLFITDTEYSKYSFRAYDVAHIFVEANYAKEFLDEEGEEDKRTHVIEGHMDIETTCRLLKANKTDNLKSVVLLHLSDTNSDEEMFAKRASEVVNCPVYIAKPGLEVELI